MSHYPPSCTPNRKKRSMLLRGITSLLPTLLLAPFSQGAAAAKIVKGRRNSHYAPDTHDLLNRRLPSDNTCGTDTSDLLAQVVVEVVGRPALITAADIDNLQNAFLETYNDYSTSSCNDVSGYRNATDVTITLQDYSTDDGSVTQDFSLLVSVEGKCNGCDANSTRVFHAYSHRLLEEEEKEEENAEGAAFDERDLSNNVQSGSYSQRQYGSSGNGRRYGGGSGNTGGVDRATSSSQSGNDGCSPSSRPHRPSPWHYTPLPTIAPTLLPTSKPRRSPTTVHHTPHVSPHRRPSVSCGPGCSLSTPAPTPSPTLLPTSSPTPDVTPSPTAEPTIADTPEPTLSPSTTSAPLSFRTTCSCPGITRFKFRNYFNESIQGLTSSIDEVDEVFELQQTCDSSVPITTFSTTVAVAFERGNWQITTLDSQLAILEDAFQLSYNEVNAYNGELCDENYHVITSVTMEPGFSLGRRRRLRQSGGWNGTAPYNGTEYDVVFAIVNGTCRGCANDSNVFAPDTSHLTGRVRLLSQPNNQCSCAVGATSGLPSVDTFIYQFGELVYGLVDTGVITAFGNLADIVAVRPVACSKVQDRLNNTVQLEVETTTALNVEDLRQLENVFTNCFNELARRSCDPYFTNVVYAEVLHVDQVQSFRSLATTKVSLSSLLLVVTGQCRGCKKKVTLFNDGIKATSTAKPAAKIVAKPTAKPTTKKVSAPARVRRRRLLDSHGNILQPSLALTSIHDPFHIPFRALQWFQGDDDKPPDFAGHQFTHTNYFGNYIGNKPNSDVCFCDRDATDSSTPTLDEFVAFFNQTVLLQNLSSIGDGGILTISVVTS